MSKDIAISKESKDQEWKWKVESAARTLLEAEKIKRDPKLLAAVRVELTKQKKELDSAVKEMQ